MMHADVFLKRGYEVIEVKSSNALRIDIGEYGERGTLTLFFANPEAAAHVAKALNEAKEMK